MAEHKNYLVCVTLDELSGRDIRIVDSNSNYWVIERRIGEIFNEKKNNPMVFQLNGGTRKVSASIDEYGKVTWNASRWRRKPENKPLFLANSFYEMEQREGNDYRRKIVHEFWCDVTDIHLDNFYKSWDHEHAQRHFDTIVEILLWQNQT